MELLGRHHCIRSPRVEFHLALNSLHNGINPKATVAWAAQSTEHSEIFHRVALSLMLYQLILSTVLWQFVDF
jgi:hypothetical protein